MWLHAPVYSVGAQCPYSVQLYTPCESVNVSRGGKLGIQSLPHRSLIKHSRSMTSPSFWCYKLSHSPACPSSSRPILQRSLLYRVQALFAWWTNIIVDYVAGSRRVSLSNQGCFMSCWILSLFSFCLPLSGPLIISGEVKRVSMFFWFSFPSSHNVFFLQLSSMPPVSTPVTPAGCLSRGVGDRQAEKKRKLEEMERVR